MQLRHNLQFTQNGHVSAVVAKHCGVHLTTCNLLAATFANDQTGVSQTELVHAPERVDRLEETVDWVSV
jgi:hypothetical protein